ncbi:unnamed protein product, partial [Mesorhabditis spiculigera]
MSDASSQEASEESTDESSFIDGRIFNIHRTRDIFNSVPLMRDSIVKLLVRQLVVRGRSANNVVEYSFIERLLRGHDDDWLRRKWFRRVSVWAKQQPDGSEKTVIHIDGQRYNDDLTAFLINRATTVYTIRLDRTITELPAFVTRFPKCHEFDFYLDEDVEDPTWPGLVDFLKRQRMANLTINSPCLRAEPLWADVLRSGGWTNKRLAGWKSVTIHNVIADDLRLLTRFNGTTLRIIWCPHNPPDENLVLWDYINNMADRRLEIGQGITVHFNQGAMPNMSSPTILFAGKTLSAEGRGYSLRYVLRDGTLPYTIIAQYDTLRLRSLMKLTTCTTSANSSRKEKLIYGPVDALFPLSGLC